MRAFVPAALLARSQPPIEEAFAKVKASLRKFEARAPAKVWWKRWAGHLML